MKAVVLGLGLALWAGPAAAEEVRTLRFDVPACANADDFRTLLALMRPNPGPAFVQRFREFERAGRCVLMRQGTVVTVTFTEEDETMSRVTSPHGGVVWVHCGSFTPEPKP